MDSRSLNSFNEVKRKRKLRAVLVFACLVFSFFFLLALNLCTGNVEIPISSIFRILTAGSGSREEVNIVWRIRLPRTLMAALLGGALSLSGFLLQTFFENPIAGPFVLGISSGAKMFVAVVMIFFLSRFGAVSSYVLVSAAFVGAMLVTFLVLLCARVVRQMATLLLAGIMVGYICSAITDFAVTFAEDADIVSLHDWSKGSFSSMNWGNICTASMIIGFCIVMAFLLSKPIGAYQLGEAYAQSMGVNVKRFRAALIVLSSLLSAVVTAFAGPISFVGIAVPFLTRQALKTSRPILVIPATFLMGSVFCMGCDLIARMAFAPTQLNISTVTSVFGAPVVIVMLLRRKRG